MRTTALFLAASILALGLGNGSPASEKTVSSDLDTNINAPPGTSKPAGFQFNGPKEFNFYTAPSGDGVKPDNKKDADQAAPKTKVDPATKPADDATAQATAEAEAQAAARALAEDTAAVTTARNDFEAAAQAAKLDMTRLGTRLTEFESRATNSGVTLKQVAATYTSLTELLNSTNNGPHFDTAQRCHLVELVIHNLARPTKIDQGAHPTCNVTTLEVYIAARHPDVYADLVKQVTLTGEYVTEKKETIHPPKAALMPGEDEKTFDMDKPAGNKRNHASQVIQMTLINGVYETGRYHSTDNSGKKINCTGWRYVMGPPVKEWFQVQGRWAYTTSEDKLLDGNGKQVRDGSGKLSTSPIFIGDDVLAASEMVLGYKMPYLNSPYKVGNQPWVFDLPTRERLLKYKQDGKFPLGVPTMMGNHVQTIHDVVVENGTCWILIDNQHGEGKDGWITLSELHKTMQDANYDLKPRKTRP